MFPECEDEAIFISHHHTYYHIWESRMLIVHKYTLTFGGFVAVWHAIRSYHIHEFVAWIPQRGPNNKASVTAVTVLRVLLRFRSHHQTLINEIVRCVRIHFANTNGNLLIWIFVSKRHTCVYICYGFVVQAPPVDVCDVCVCMWLWCARDTFSRR